VLEVIPTLNCFVVEELRTARRFLSAAGLKGHIDELEFHELNEHTKPQEVEAFAKLFDEGRSVGLLSEAGLPAVADPGALLVALCHRHGIEVVPLVGPSSLMLALMASGLNGQSFAFVGYIPAKTEERRAALRTLEKRSASARQTQILIETPYRNDSLMADLLSCLNGHTRVCVAANLTCPDQFIQTRTVAEWKSKPITIGKRPCVFLILSV
jgi:16S rRNA (cytidine1402-2'-O)-methyltransferase